MKKKHPFYNSFEILGKRNADIYHLRTAGFSFVELAKIYTISPGRAAQIFHKSARIMKQKIVCFELSEKGVERATPIESSSLSTRSKNALIRENILYLSELENKTDEELLEIRNFGLKCLKEARKLLKKVKK